MKIIVGLGNPGKEYTHTRHNVGFMLLDLLRDQLEFRDFQSTKKFQAEISEGTFNGDKLILAKPETFMNLSGDSVSKLVNFYHCDPKDLCVVYDDIDLPLGSMRFRMEGSAGTHNGMRDIIEKLGFNNFPRLRIGIESRGQSSPKEQDISSFVLQPFSDDETKVVHTVLNEAAKSLTEYLEKN